MTESTRMYYARKLAAEVGTPGLTENQKQVLQVVFSQLAGELRKIGDEAIANRYEELSSQFAAGKRGLANPLKELLAAVQALE